MKKLQNSILLILALVSFSACKGDLDSLEDGNHRSQRIKNRQMVKTVRMSFGGDFITESEEPLLRAEDGEFFAGINVWRTENKDGAKEEKYAYGLFKKENGIEIDLVTGYTYRFEASILIEGDEDKVYVDNGYLAPFMIKDSKAVEGQSYPDKLNVFNYTYNLLIDDKLVANDYRNYLHQLSSGTAHVVCEEMNSTHVDLSYPRVKRFYGNISDIHPEVVQSVEIGMNYKCFGLRFLVEKLPSGYLTVQDITKKNAVADKEKNEKLVFPTNLSLGLEDRDEVNYFKNEWEGVFSMNNLGAEYESINLKFNWHKGGNSVQSFNCKVDVYPGVKKTLKINVTGTPNYSQGGNIVLKMLDETLKEEKGILKYDADKDANNKTIEIEEDNENAE